MKPYAFLALMVAVAGFISTIAAIEIQRKPKEREEVIYILPKVEDMYEKIQPLQI